MYPARPETIKASELLALGEMYANLGGEKVALEVLRRGGDKADFMRRLAEESRVRELTAGADAALGVSSDHRELQGYSLSRALRAAMDRQWNDAPLERDISNLATTRTDAVPTGFFVPMSVLAGAFTRDFNIGTATEAGNLAPATVNASVVNDPLRKLTALGRMGATILTGLKTTVSLPRFAVTTEAGWKSEIAAATEITETTETATLTPKRTTVIMTMSRQALIQATPTLDATIGRHLSAALMSQLDDSAVNGDGTSDAPVGLRSTSGITNVAGGTNGAQLTYALLADLEKAPSALNCEDGVFSGFILNSKTRRWLRTQPRGTGLPYIWEGGERPLLGYRAAVSEIIPGTLTKGTSSGVCSSVSYSSDWSQLVVGFYGGGVDVVVDRVTLAYEGKLRVIASVLVGVGLNQPSAFAKIDDALTA